MLAIIVAIVFLAACVNLNSSITSQRRHILKNQLPLPGGTGVSPVLFGMWLYLVPVMIFIVPIPPMIYLVLPVPFAILLFLPGICFARRLEKRLDTSGTDYGARLAKEMSSVLWLGYGGILYVVIQAGGAWFGAWLALRWRSLPDQI